MYFQQAVPASETNYRHKTHNIGKWKYHCTAELLFDWFSFDQTSKTVFHSTQTKQLNPNKICKISGPILRTLTSP